MKMIHPLEDCVVIPFLSLRATEGSVAISVCPVRCEIASVVLLPRNDIATQSLGGDGMEMRFKSEEYS